MGPRASFHWVSAIGSSLRLSLTVSSWAPLKRASPRATKELIRTTLINLFTLREEQINLSRVSRIPADLDFYNLVKLGFSEEEGAQLQFPDPAMRDELINLSRQDLLDEQTFEDGAAEFEDPKETTGTGDSEGSAPQADVSDSQRSVDEQLSTKALETETSLDSGTEPVVAERKEDVANIEAADVFEQDAVEPEDPVLDEDPWMNIPIKGVKFKFIVRHFGDGLDSKLTMTAPQAHHAADWRSVS